VPGRQNKKPHTKNPWTLPDKSRGELMAIVKALSITPKGKMLMIALDSMYAIQGIIENLRSGKMKAG